MDIEKYDLVVDASHESDFAAKLFLGKFMANKKQMVKEAMACIRAGLVIDCGPENAYVLVMWPNNRTELTDARDVIPIDMLDEHIEKSLKSDL